MPAQNNTNMTPIGGDNIPPMDSTSEQGSEMLPDFNEPQENNLDSDFDTNFDAGVEADEDTDPKKYIQQLTGKLSQTLNTYNNENGEPDVELGKYVLGMLVKQGVKGMDEKDKKEIIKKINIGSSENNEAENNDSVEDSEMTDDISDEMQMESKTLKFTKKQIFESFGVAMNIENGNNNNDEPDTKIKSDVKRNRRTRPFEAPKKFK